MSTGRNMKPNFTSWSRQHNFDSINLGRTYYMIFQSGQIQRKTRPQLYLHHASQMQIWCHYSYHILNNQLPEQMNTESEETSYAVLLRPPYTKILSFFTKK